MSINWFGYGEKLLNYIVQRKKDRDKQFKEDAEKLDKALTTISDLGRNNDFSNHYGNDLDQAKTDYINQFENICSKYSKKLVSEDLREHITFVLKNNLVDMKTYSSPGKAIKSVIRYMKKNAQKNTNPLIHNE